jgi:cellulose synthase/poly-beta-1,6-N-acetylglucosamine synthase-like glycosyltransferase
MSVIFWIAVALLGHAYAGYPLSLLALRPFLRRRAAHRTGDHVPPVALVIVAHNEEDVLAEKLRNSLALDYPPERLRVLVVSDASTDATEAIARSFNGSGVECVAFRDRQGKASCLNRVLPTLTEGLVVLSDANSMYDRGSLRALARHFADERVGCVCGELRYANPRRLAAGEVERLYWDYERAIKRLESDLGCLLGANGAIYAFRAGSFRPVDPFAGEDDLIPIRLAISGALVLYDPEARCTEESMEEAVEIRRRRRHAFYGLHTVAWTLGLALRAGRPLVLYECVSHRLLRWLGGPALILALAATPWLPSGWRAAAVAAQALFYGAALVGWLGSRLGIPTGPCYRIYYFLVINLAGMQGLWTFLTRTGSPVWEPRR